MEKSIRSLALALASFMISGCMQGAFDPTHETYVVDSGSMVPVQPSVPSSAIGKQLYMQNCAACHSSPPDTRADGAGFDEIKSSILVVGAMKLPQLQGLTDQELTAIAVFLGGAVAAPQNPNTPGQPPSPVNPTPAAYTPPSSAPLQKAEAFGESGMQRLTARQLEASVEQNLGISVDAYTGEIPVDSSSSTHFENDYTQLSVTYSIVDSYDQFADTVSKAFSINSFKAVAGCTPIGASDRNCFEKFTKKMGRRFLRRPLTAQEIAAYSDTLLPYAIEEGQFMSAVEMILQVWLQHPEFLYRVEASMNTAAPAGFARLSPYVVATRMSYLLTGRGPSDALLDAAATGQLDSASGRVTWAQSLLGTAAATQNWSDFHGQWLGYGGTVLEASLASDMLLETGKLVEQVNFAEKADWLSIFTSDKTYLTPKLANHYKIPGVSTAGWVKTSGVRGGGILSHGSFAATGRKFGDTSPTLRGYEVFKRIFCGKFTGSIPANVDVNEAPGQPNDCKPQRYTMRSISSCAGCHSVTDGIGFGLELVGSLGEIRTFEAPNTSCQITGYGDYKGQNFTGPKGLGQLISSSPEVGACATKHVFEYMMGRSATDDDQETLDALEGEYFESRSLQGILKDIVKSEAMIYKRSL